MKRLFESYEKYLTDGLAEKKQKQLSVSQVHQSGSTFSMHAVRISEAFQKPLHFRS